MRSSAPAAGGHARRVALGLLGLRVSLWCLLATTFSSILLSAAVNDNPIALRMLPVTAPLTLALLTAFTLFAVLGLVACLWIPPSTGARPWIVMALVVVASNAVLAVVCPSASLFSFFALFAVLWGLRKLANSQGAYGEVRAADAVLRKLVFMALLILGSLLLLLTHAGFLLIFLWPALALAMLYLTITAWFECDALFSGLRKNLLRQGLV